MADTALSLAPYNTIDARNNVWGIYWYDVDTGYIVYQDTNQYLVYGYTLDGGATWTKVTINAGITTDGYATWFDRQTPGDTGNLLHIVFYDATGGPGSSIVYYCNLDLSDRTLSTPVAIYGTSQASANNNWSITKTRNGNLYMSYNSATDSGFYKSTNGGASWASRANVNEAVATNDGVRLFPANTGDDSDVCCLFHDKSANQVSIKMYDDSANSWTETAVDSTELGIGNYWLRDGGAALRSSDGHIIMAYHTNDNSTTDDLRVWDINPNSIASPGKTQKTNVFTDLTACGGCAVFIHPTTEDIYIAYIGRYSTYNNASHINQQVSTDGGSTWSTWDGSNVSAGGSYVSETPDDLRVIGAPHVDAALGGQIMWVWYNDDFEDLYVNIGNSVEIAATVGGGGGDGIAASKRSVFF